MADIRIDRIAKSFGTTRALDEILLDVADGEFVALLGPSGCGKTTLLRIIAGLETQSAGRIVIGGRDVTDLPVRARRLAMVFQNYAVFPHMTVYENIAFGLRMQRADDARVRRQVMRAAGLLHIEAVLDRYPAKLSGGQRQRVAVARALANDPPIILADEPTGSLDSRSSEQVFEILRDLVARHGKTVVAVTHDLGLAARMSRRIHLVDGAIATDEVAHGLTPDRQTVLPDGNDP